MKTLSVSKIVGFFALRKMAARIMEVIYADRKPSFKSPSSPSIDSYCQSASLTSGSGYTEGSPILPGISDGIADDGAPWVLRISPAPNIRTEINPYTFALQPEGLRVFNARDGRLSSEDQAPGPIWDFLQFTDGSSLCHAERSVTNTTNDPGGTGIRLRSDPNPSSSTTRVLLNEFLPKDMLGVFNTDGRQVLRSVITAPLTPLDLSGLPTGMYILRYGNDRAAFVKHAINQ